LKINKLKINAYGKIKEKEIDLKNNINIIYGKNEAGKSTILNFIINSFYGISKNKNGKNISDFDKYTPWVGDEFSGKLEYELENQEKFEIFRDFKKKNPKIFNSEMEDISKQFNIDKNKGNEFFYEQTKVDESLFLSTVLIRQQEVKLEKQDQNVLIQKVANLVGTGEDNVSYKRAKDRMNRRLLEEIGTERTREKPINLLQKEIEELEKEKEELEKSVDIKCEIEEKKNSLTKEIERLEIESENLKKEKLKQENEKIENEKNNLEINLKNNLKNENNEKINAIKNKIEEINLANKTILEKNKKINTNKNNIDKKVLIIFLGIILINILQFIIIKNKYFNYIFLLTVPVTIIFYLFFKNKQKEQKIKDENNLQKINTEIKQLNFEIDLLEKNNKKLEEEINKINIEKNEINNLEKINFEIQNIENKLNNKKIELHTLQIDYKSIEPKLENLAKIEEKLVNGKEKMVNLKRLEKSMKLAGEILDTSYNKMKNTVTPRFTDKLSETIQEITEGKYQKVRLNDDTGLVVELENGNYIPADRLSIGTIDQLYLSLRLAMVEDLSAEKMPIILDEAFAYYDRERLKNVLKYMTERFNLHQIMIFTCTEREKEILEELEIQFNMINL
jgi:uncharacterized protein YhaN